MERKRSLRRQRRYRRPWWKKCKELFRQFVAFLFSNIGIIGLVVGYTIAGSFIFQTIESKHIIEMKFEVVRNRSLYAQKLWNITMQLNEKVMDKEVFYKSINQELFEYQKIIVNFSRRGYDGTDDKDASAQWSFAGAFLYSLTVITTIGYGNIFPRTPEGKIITIFYAIIGMPLFLLYLSNIGDIMARSFKWIYANCCLCRWCPGVAKRRAERRMRREQRLASGYEESEEEEDSENSSQTWEITIPIPQLDSRGSISSEVQTTYTDDAYDVQNVTVPLTICLLIMVGYICGGALLFCKWEEYWTFLDASYFCFISLSTIGFGDLVPGDKIYGRGVSDILELSFVFCSIYLMMGMALIAMCFNLMQEEVIHKIRTTIQTIKYVLRCNR